MIKVQSEEVLYCFNYNVDINIKKLLQTNICIAIQNMGLID